MPGLGGRSQGTPGKKPSRKKVAAKRPRQVSSSEVQGNSKSLQSLFTSIELGLGDSVDASAISEKVTAIGGCLPLETSMQLFAGASLPTFDEFQSAVTWGASVAASQVQPAADQTSKLNVGLDPVAQARFVKEEQTVKKRECVRVMVRVRPFMKYEIKKAGKGLSMDPIVFMTGSECQVMKTKGPKVLEEVADSYKFDDAFWSIPQSQCAHGREEVGQEEVFQKTGRPAVDHAFAGYNTCIFAYGQTGSGKTHTMLGNDSDPGIAPQLVHRLFDRIKECQANGERTKFTVSICFMEIYNEKVMDLMEAVSCPRGKVGSPRGSPRGAASTSAHPVHLGDDDDKYRECKVRYSPDKGTYVEGITRVTVKDGAEVMKHMNAGVKHRATASHDMNATSSRSHAIFQLTLKQDTVLGTTRISTMNIVDLAGSERQKQTQSTGTVLTEAKNINQSLSTLRRVMDVLVENSKKSNKIVPPFRESMLTWVLKDSLGGNSKTLMIAAISPHVSNADDTINTLRYALKAKSIVLHATVNEEKTATLVGAMKAEIEALKQKLLSGEGGVDTDAVKREVEAQLMEKQKAFDDAKNVAEEAQQAAEELEKKLVQQEKEAEERMEQQAKEAEEKYIHLEEEAKEDRKKRFAAVFRQAFRIEKRKEDEDQQVAEAKEETEAAREEARRARAEAEEQLIEKDAEISEIQRQLTDVERRLRGVLDEHEALKKGKRDAAEMLTVKEKQLSDLREEHEKLSGVGKEEVDKLQTDLIRFKGIENDHDRLRDHHSDLQRRHDGIAAERVKAENIITALEQRMSRILAEKEDLGAHNSELQAESMAQLSEIERLRDAEAQVKADFERAKLCWEDEKAEIEDQNRGLKDETSIQKQNRDEEGVRNSALKEQVLRNRFNAVHQANDLEEAHARIKQLEAETSDLRQQVVLAQSQLARRQPTAYLQEEPLEGDRARDFIATRLFAHGELSAADMAQPQPRRNTSGSQPGSGRVWQDGHGRTGYSYPSGSPHRQQASPPRGLPMAPRRSTTSNGGSATRSGSREAGRR